MENKRFRDELLYQVTMNAARQMLKNDAISERDFRKIKEHFIEKYNPPLGTLLSENELT